MANNQSQKQQPYFATYIQDLEQDPFDAVDFVERLAWRMTGGREQEGVDAAFLKNKFEEEIGSLQLLSEQFQSKINALEQQQNNEKTNYLDTLSRLHDKNGESLEKLKAGQTRKDPSSTAIPFPPWHKVRNACYRRRSMAAINVRNPFLPPEIYNNTYWVAFVFEENGLNNLTLHPMITTSLQFNAHYRWNFQFESYRLCSDICNLRAESTANAMHHIIPDELELLTVFRRFLATVEKKEQKQLDGTMQTVSAKVVHLGDQLESVHAPRARAFEALQLMRHFDEFLLVDQALHSDIFVDPDRLLESAEMIQKLSSISQELAREKYAAVQMRIAHKYDEIEQLLIEEFIKSHDRKRLKEIANILSEFKGFSQCLDAFVERVQNSAFRSGNVFEDILALCEKTNPMLAEIFPNPSQVMAKLILNVFHGKLQTMDQGIIQNLKLHYRRFLLPGFFQNHLGRTHFTPDQ